MIGFIFHQVTKEPHLNAPVWINIANISAMEEIPVSNHTRIHMVGGQTFEVRAAMGEIVQGMAGAIQAAQANPPRLPIITHPPGGNGRRG